MSRPSWRKGVAPTPDDINESNESSSQSQVVVRSTPTSSSSSFIGSLSPYESTGAVFFEVSMEFVTASKDVWPTDSLIVKQKSELDLVTSMEQKQIEGLKLSKLFHTTFSEHYNLIVAKDSTFFTKDIKVLKDLDAHTKFTSSSPSVQETIWEYLRSLVQYAGMAEMYSKCPRGMLDSISGMAGNLISKMQSGEMDANALNPLELGQMLMKDMNMSDLEGFGSALMENGNIDNMMSIMQSTMSSMQSKGGIPGMPGMDINGLMSMMGNMRK